MMPNGHLVQLPNKILTKAITERINDSSIDFNVTYFDSESELQKETEMLVVDPSIRKKIGKKKKSKNFDPNDKIVVLIRKITLELADCYFRNKFPDYVFCNEWFLAQFVGSINVAPEKNVLVVDNSQGIVITHILNKLEFLSQTKVYFSVEALHLYEFHNIEAVSMLNKTQIFRSHAHFIPYQNLETFKGKFSTLAISGLRNATRHIEIINNLLNSLEIGGEFIFFSRKKKVVQEIAGLLASSNEFVSVTFQEIPVLNYREYDTFKQKISSKSEIGGILSCTKVERTLPFLGDP